MNSDASNRDSGDPDPAAHGNAKKNAVSDGMDGPAHGGYHTQSRSEPIQARLVETTAEDSPLRVGSPFAVDPLIESPIKRVEPFLDVGPIRYTAMGAVAASVMVLGFASAAAWWFPTGGALIAALGCVLSIFGLYSRYRFTSAGLLSLHLCLFVFSYGRSLG